MLKSDLVAALMEKRGMSASQAEAAVETMLEAMSEALCAGQGVEIRGFGTFHVKHYDGYQGHNPRTGQVVSVKAKRGVLFRTGQELKARMNPSEEPVPGKNRPSR